MKRIKKLLPAVLMLFVVVFSGCERNREINKWEIFPNGKKNAIEQMVDGISFTFCLLNEQGEPATVFNEGENFTLYFRIKNETGKDYDYDPYDDCAHKDDLFTVYHTSGKKIGKPYEALPTPSILRPHPFNNQDSYAFEVPWLHSENTVVTSGDFQYISVKMEPLKAGYYYTSFTHRFKMYDKGSKRQRYFETEELHFKINFLIR